MYHYPSSWYILLVKSFRKQRTMRLGNKVFAMFSWCLPKCDAARKTSKTIWWQPFILAGDSAFSSDLFRCMTRVSETKQLEWFQTWSLDVTGRSLFVHLRGVSCGLKWCTQFLQDGDPSESLFCSGSSKDQRIIHLRTSNCRNRRTAQQINNNKYSMMKLLIQLAGW